MYIVTANSCNWRCSVQVELPSVSLGLLSQHRSFMSKYGIAHSHASISKRMVPLLAHHQMLCYCRLHNYSVVLQTQTREQKTRAWLRKTIVASIVIVFVDVMAEISARSSVSSLRLRLCNSILGHS